MKAVDPTQGLAGDFSASLKDLSLEAVLELLVRSGATGLLRVEGEAAGGEILLEGGRLYDAALRYPGRASGRRALDYLLGLREGEARLFPERISRPPTLGGDLLELAFAARRAAVWKRAFRLPRDWSLRVVPQAPLGPLQPLLDRAQGKTLAEALLLYGALPSTVALVLSSLAGVGFLDFRRERSSRFPFLPWRP